MGQLTAFDCRGRCVSGLPLRVINSFPKPGIDFIDIGPWLANPVQFADLMQSLSMAMERFKPVTHIVALDARGFIFAGPLSNLHNAGILMARKAGKLPGEVVRTTYGLEYGEATLELQTGLFPFGARVLIVDDVLATGGTIEAAYKLIKLAGGNPVGALCPFELPALGGAERLRELDDAFKVFSVYRLGFK